MADVGPLSVHAHGSPLHHLVRHMFIERLSVDQTVLEFPAGRIGSLDQDKNALVILIARVNKGLYAVRAQIGIHRHHIRSECGELFIADPDCSKMTCRIGCGSRTDISALRVADHDQALFLAVPYCLLIDHEARNAELFIHRDLGLHRGDQIPGGVDDRLVELPHGLRSSFRSPPPYRQ